MFVGEAPGHDEDVQGIPFVGRAGQLLTKIIEAIGLTREDVYIANVIKCRPPENRNPEPDEVATLRAVPVPAGPGHQAAGDRGAGHVRRPDAAAHERPDLPPARPGLPLRRRAPRFPTFHPAYLLRSPERKRDVWEDMKKVRALLRGEDAGDDR